MRACPYCEREIQDEAIVCRYCGLDVEPPDWLRGKMRCPYCAEWIGADQTLCPYCKSELSEKPEPSPAHDRPAAAASPSQDDSAFLNEVEREAEGAPPPESRPASPSPSPSEPERPTQQPYGAADWTSSPEDDPLRAQPLDDDSRRFQFAVPEVIKELPTGRLLRTGALALLLFAVIGAAVAFARRYQGELPSLAAAPATETPAATAVTPEATSTDAVAASATDISAVTTSPASNECVRWDEVTLDEEGEEICVYGTVKRWFASGDLPFVAIFTEKPGTFALVDRGRDHPSVRPGDCISGTGPVEVMSATRPFIDLDGEVGPCPE